jgi:hypothetical protein
MNLFQKVLNREGKVLIQDLKRQFRLVVGAIIISMINLNLRHIELILDQKDRKISKKS